MAYGMSEKKSSTEKNDRYPRGSGKPYGAIGERGFPPPAPLTGEAGSLRPRPRRPTALRLDNAQHHRETICTKRERLGGRDLDYSVLLDNEITSNLELRSENLRIEVRTPILRQIAADPPT
jgi:hypothetical protein